MLPLWPFHEKLAVAFNRYRLVFRSSTGSSTARVVALKVARSAIPHQTKKGCPQTHSRRELNRFFGNHRQEYRLPPLSSCGPLWEGPRVDSGEGFLRSGGQGGHLLAHARNMRSNAGYRCDIVFFIAVLEQGLVVFSITTRLYVYAFQCGKRFTCFTENLPH